MAFQQGLSGLSIVQGPRRHQQQRVQLGHRRLQAGLGPVRGRLSLRRCRPAARPRSVSAASVGNVAQQFTQGNISTSSNTADLAVNGAGFFRMSDSGTITTAATPVPCGYGKATSSIPAACVSGNTYDAKGPALWRGRRYPASFGDADPKATTDAGYTVNLIPARVAQVAHPGAPGARARPSRRPRR